MSLNVVILAAGMGTRLGRPHPKPLTPIADGRSILRQQLDHLRATFGADAHITIVVGFKMDLIMEAAASDAAFVYNELYDQTNTCKSLLKALRTPATMASMMSSTPGRRGSRYIRALEMPSSNRALRARS